MSDAGNFEKIEPKQMSESVLEQFSAPEIDGIEIIELLGKGGMSLVYKARQRQLDRIVAVKVLSKSALGEDGIKRFHNEAKITSTLEHPNIVKIISFGLSKDGRPYLVMEYLEGRSLADDLQENGRLTLQKFRDVFLPVLSALGSAHDAGLIHRDIKPANIMICRHDDGSEVVKLVDFGIAKFSDEKSDASGKLTRTGALIGSPIYMSPEQCQNQSLDCRSDLYSVACVMYESLCGEPPFSGDSVLEVMHKHSLTPPLTVAELERKIHIGRELASVVLWGLAKEPAARPQTAVEFSRKLNEVLESITLHKIPRLNSERAQKKHRVLLISTVCSCALCLVFCSYIVLKKSSSSKEVLAVNVNPPFSKRAAIRGGQKKTLGMNQLLADAERSFEKCEYVDAADCYAQVLKRSESSVHKLSQGQLEEIKFRICYATGYTSVGLKHFAEARKAVSLRLPEVRRYFGAEDVRVAELLYILAEAEEGLQNYAAAEMAVQQCLDIRIKIAGGFKSTKVAQVLGFKAHLVEKRHDLERAIEINEKAKSIWIALLGHSDFGTLNCILYSGKLWARVGDQQKSELCFKQAADGLAASSEEFSAKVRFDLMNEFLTFYKGKHRWAMIDKTYDELISSLKVARNSDLYLGTAYLEAASYYHSINQETKALGLARQAHDTLTRCKSADSQVQLSKLHSLFPEL